MKDDVIVEEIHQVRATLLDQHNDDLDALLDHFQAAEALHNDRLVTVETMNSRRGREDETVGKNTFRLRRKEAAGPAGDL